MQVAGASEGPWTTIAASIRGSPTTGSGYVSGETAGIGPKNIEVRDVIVYTFPFVSPATPATLTNFTNIYDDTAPLIATVNATGGSLPSRRPHTGP